MRKSVCKVLRRFAAIKSDPNSNTKMQYIIIKLRAGSFVYHHMCEGTAPDAVRRVVTLLDEIDSEREIKPSEYDDFLVQLTIQDQIDVDLHNYTILVIPLQRTKSEPEPYRNPE